MIKRLDRKLKIKIKMQRITQNREDVKKLEERLHQLDDDISSIPVPLGISKHRDDLTQ